MSSALAWVWENVVGLVVEDSQLAIGIVLAVAMGSIKETRLRVAQFRPAAGFGWIIVSLTIGKLHDEKREIALIPDRAPSAVHADQQIAVLIRPDHITLSLIPKHSFGCKRNYRCQHAVIHLSGMHSVNLEIFFGSLFFKDRRLFVRPVGCPLFYAGSAPRYRHDADGYTDLFMYFLSKKVSDS